ncbi:MAG TPA: DUF2059 domain-containing protein [Hyphomicrobiaceae bacterium]|jgi:hypothetical protein|nr:DUF2059 domain-containing protein [Hyphomicrobiaceae bacterium]
MSILRTTMFAAGFASALATATFAQQRGPANDKGRTAALELMEATGASAQFDQVIPVLTGQLTQSFVHLAPDRASEIREVMGELVKRFSQRKAELIDEVALIYAQKMSVDDMREVAKFYQSGAGRRLVEAQPQILRQSMSVGQAWGQRIGAELDAEMRRELKKRGIDL